MTKFELPEKPKKTNTSEDFNNLRKAVDELDKFDYTWKMYANKADRRINAANKYIEELERENQRLVAENLTVKTLVDSAKPQQALPVMPECVGSWIEKDKNYGRSVYHGLRRLDDEVGVTAPRDVAKWVFENNENLNLFIRAWLDGYTIEKPQLFYLREKNTNYYLNMSKNNGLELVPNPYFDEDNQFTQQEIDSMETGSYELVPVEDGE
ncbi:DUF1642 domain-containing protein [Lactococcus sp.]|uniref:DUF1642 domain-containing protein n=1 Tax=Lactococcus sp. TaxID=44273 RepID=UPI002FC84DAA